MNIRNYTLGVLLLSTATVFGQSTISSSNLPVIGDSTIISICDQTVDPGMEGEDQTWDMTWLIESEEQYFIYVDPSETPFVDEFSESNLCGISWEGYYSYYNTNNDALEAVGYAGVLAPSDTFTQVFDNTEAFIPIPYSYGDTQYDEFDGINNALGFAVPFTGSVDFEVDGYGTLILPTGTYNNVLRYHFFREQESTFFGSTTTATKDQWAWVSSDHRFWLLLMEENDDGFSTTPFIWYNKSPEVVSPVNILDVADSNIAISPNPIISSQSINFSWDASENSILNWVNLNGQIIHSSSIQLNDGVNQVSVPNLLSGMYLLKIKGTNTIKTAKVIVAN